MRIKLDLLNVSSKPLLRVDTGNLSETCGMSNAENKCLSVGYQLTHTVRWRTSSIVVQLSRQKSKLFIMN